MRESGHRITNELNFFTFSYTLEYSLWFSFLSLPEWSTRLQRLRQSRQIASQDRSALQTSQPLFWVNAIGVRHWCTYSRTGMLMHVDASHMVIVIVMSHITYTSFEKFDWSMARLNFQTSCCCWRAVGVLASRPLTWACVTSGNSWMHQLEGMLMACMLLPIAHECRSIQIELECERDSPQIINEHQLNTK